MIDWIKATHGLVASVPAVFSTMVACCNLGLPPLVFSPEPAPIHRRIAALEQFNRDTRLLVLDQARWSANPLAVLWPEDGRGELSVFSRKQHLWGGSHRFGNRGIPVEVRSVMPSPARSGPRMEAEYGWW